MRLAGDDPAPPKQGLWSWDIPLWAPNKPCFSPLMVLGGRWHGEMSRAVGAASTGEEMGSKMLWRAEPPPRRAGWWLRQDPAPLLLPAKQGEGSSTLPLASR